MSTNSLNTPLVSDAGKDALHVKPFRIFALTAAAAVLNLLALWLGTAAGASLITNAPEPINAISVIVATVLPLLLMGALVWWLAPRFALRRLAGWAGLIFAIASSAGSFAFSADTTTALTLGSMHFITGFAWFIALKSWVK